MPEWDDDEDDSNLVKQLRKQLKDMNSAKAELEKEVSTLRPQVRRTSVSSILSDLGLNTKIAALLPESVEPSKEAVSAWLKEYGELFSIPKAEEKPETNAVGTATEPLAGQKAPPVDQATQDQWQKIQSAESAAGASAPDVEKQQLAELGRAVEASGGSFDKFIGLVRGELPIPS